jgi:hypothetical protein
MAKPKRQPGVITVEQVVAALETMLVSKSSLDWTVTGRETPNSVPWICVASPVKRRVQGAMSLEDRASPAQEGGREVTPDESRKLGVVAFVLTAISLAFTALGALLVGRTAVAVLVPKQA